jgi:hypothetical protein
MWRTTSAAMGMRSQLSVAGGRGHHARVFAVAFGSLLLMAPLTCTPADQGAKGAWPPVPNVQPNPRLADLADGEALDLGPYECEGRVPGMRCATIFDYSRINYDPYNHRILLFGGGHAATGRTDVDVFDLRTLKWHSLYPSMTCDEVAEQDLDPRGFHRKTGHPVARHTYDQNVIAEVDGTGWLLMFSTEGFSGTCHQYNAPINAVAGLRLDADSAKWSFSPELPIPWGYAGSAEFDPVSGMVILFGGRSRGMWVYDPSERRIVASVRRFDRAKNSSNLIYDPRGDRMYLIDRETLDIRMYELNRENWQETTETVIRAGGDRPPAFRNLAYDSRNHVIGGIQDGVLHTFDLTSHEWRSYPVRERSPDGRRIGMVRHHAIDYDPVNNVFILVSGAPRFVTNLGLSVPQLMPPAFVRRSD